jgi:hypothetical protein
VGEGKSALLGKQPKHQYFHDRLAGNPMATIYITNETLPHSSNRAWYFFNIGDPAKKNRRYNPQRSKNTNGSIELRRALLGKNACGVPDAV